MATCLKNFECLSKLTIVGKTPDPRRDHGPFPTSEKKAKEAVEKGRTSIESTPLAPVLNTLPINDAKLETPQENLASGNSDAISKTVEYTLLTSAKMESPFLGEGQNAA